LAKQQHPQRPISPLLAAKSPPTEAKAEAGTAPDLFTWAGFACYGG
jgi:hypothetical protein